MSFWDAGWVTPTEADATDSDLVELVSDIAADGSRALWLSGHSRISDEGLAVLAGSPGFTHLDLSGTSVSDEGFIHLALMQLEYLALNHTRITGTGLVHLAVGCPLKVLGLRHTALTREGILALGRFKTISKLGLTGTSALDDESVSGFAQLDSLTILDAIGTNVGDVGVEQLVANHPLRKLYLSGTQVTDAGLNTLRRLSGLSDLHLADTRVGDHGLKTLGILPALEDLDLRNTAVTGGGLLALADLPCLQTVFVSGCSVSEADLERFHACSGARLKVSDENS